MISELDINHRENTPAEKGQGTHLPDSHSLARATIFCLTAIGLSFGETVTANETQMSPYPFTKAQFDGGWPYMAVAQMGLGAEEISARTIQITEELKNHPGPFQFDLVASLSEISGTVILKSCSSLFLLQ